MKAVVAAVALLAGAAAQSTVDPVRMLPENYSLQFENAWVKVVRVRYGPHAKLPPHAHTSHPSAYVYLNDAGPVIFRHAGAKGFTATRPPTTAGSVRVFRGLEEIHEVENTTEQPSEFLRVEFKTEPRDVTTLRGRFHREVVAAGENLEKVQFENGQIRITRLVCAPGRSLAIAADSAQPSLLIDLSLAVGQYGWVEAGQSLALRNDGAEPREWLRFDLKTPPLP